MKTIINATGTGLGIALAGGMVLASLTGAPVMAAATGPIATASADGTAAGVRVTVNGSPATGSPAVGEQDAITGDLQALQVVADTAGTLSPRQQQTVRDDLRAAGDDAQNLQALTRPSGARVSTISVTASAAADGTRLTLTSGTLSCAPHALTREVSTVILTVSGEHC